MTTGKHVRTAVASLAAAAAAAILQPRSTVAEEASTTVSAPSPKGRFYAVALAATTLVHRPHVGDFGGPLKDVSPAVGAGYFVGETLAFELDVGPTFVEGEYASFGLIPAVIWAFHPNFYGTGRFILPVDPKLDLVLVPGFGATMVFANGLAPFVELELTSAVGRGKPDLGLAVALGATYMF